MTRCITAHASVFKILAALRKAGWGDLAGAHHRCHRAILDTLVSVSRSQGQDFSGYFKITTMQLADRAGYTDRHVRACIPDLEEMGLITWHRGGIAEGKPQPGFMRINKTALVALVRAARPAYDRLLNARRKETQERLQKLNRMVIFPQKPQRVSADKSHAEMISDLPLSRRACAPSAHAHAQNVSPAVDTAVTQKANEAMPMMITYQAYMQKKYSGVPSSRWLDYIDTDPVAEELAVCGAMTYDELRRFETDLRMDHVNLTGVGTRL